MQIHNFSKSESGGGRVQSVGAGGNRCSRVLSHAGDILLSLNVGFAITFAAFTYAAGDYRPVYALRWSQECLIAFQALLFRIAPLAANQPPAAYQRSQIVWELLFLSMTLTIALVLFVLGHLSNRTKLSRLNLRPLAGVTALIAVPLCWLYIVKATGVGLAGPQTFWKIYGILFGWESAVVGCLLYLLRTRTVWLGALTFILHFVFWVIVIAEHTGPPAIVSIPLLLIFPVSGIVWWVSGRPIGRSATYS